MRSLSLVLIIAGAIVGLACALADVIGLGHDPSAFGSRQLTGVLAGVVVLVIGLVLRSKAGAAPAPSSS